TRGLLTLTTTFVRPINRVDRILRREPDAIFQDFFRRVLAAQRVTLRSSPASVRRHCPTTPTRRPRLPLVIYRLDRLSCRRILFASERVSPSTRERVRSR